MTPAVRPSLKRLLCPRCTADVHGYMHARARGTVSRGKDHHLICLRAANKSGADAPPAIDLKSLAVFVADVLRLQMLQEAVTPADHVISLGWIDLQNDSGIRTRRSSFAYKSR